MPFGKAASEVLDGRCKTKCEGLTQGDQTHAQCTNFAGRTRARQRTRASPQPPPQSRPRIVLSELELARPRTWVKRLDGDDRQPRLPQVPDVAVPCKVIKTEEDVYECKESRSCDDCKPVRHSCYRIVESITDEELRIFACPEPAGLSPCR